MSGMFTPHLFNTLTIDDVKFVEAAIGLDAQADIIEDLITRINRCFESLRTDWDTDAGKEFFKRVDDTMLFHLENHSKVIRHMSKNLKTASQKYDVVFRAVENAAEAEYRQ
jgi:hypothetical protein